MPGFYKSTAVRLLHESNISVERLTHVLGCSQHEMSVALNGPHAVPELQIVIAALVQQPQSVIWPRLYTEAQVLKPEATVLRRPVRPTQWRLSQRSHADIVCMLISCGQAKAIRLIPAIVPRSARPRSLPPLISFRKTA